MRLLLKTVDVVAIGLALLGFIVLIAVAAVGALSNTWQQARFMWEHFSDRILLIVVGAAVAWCIFRWKELNKRG